MKPTFHIITAVTRTANLEAIGYALNQQARRHDIHWHVRFDPQHSSVGGQTIKNRILYQIPNDPENWVILLDDDTLIHYDLLATVEAHIGPDTNAVVVSQQKRDGSVLWAMPENVKVGNIDTGQVVMRRSFLGEERLLDAYEGDGLLFEKLLRGAQGVVYIPEILSFHNVLTK